MDRTVDVVVIGAGIVGLATARAIRAGAPDASIVVVDKEPGPSRHQTGRNSGVIHAGVYYKPGSEKARLCREGRLAMVAFCEEHNIPHKVSGKLVVAVTGDECARMVDLAERCRANDVPVEVIGAERMREHEPNVTGKAALWVPVTGVVDYKVVSAKLVELLTGAGVTFSFGTEVCSGRVDSSGVVVETTAGDVRAGRVVNCAGLHADRIARALGAPADDVRIVPFRGEYFELAPEREGLVNGLIYPVPDPRFPFLGVHLTKGVDGHVHAGPNAVLALAREGYSWHERNRADMADTFRFSGFHHLARKYWRYGMSEMHRSLSRASFTRALQRLVPDVRQEDLRVAPAGVRAQALMADGRLVDDFLFRQHGPVLHVLNAPSPAATASLAIGEMIAKRLETVNQP